MDTKSKKLNKRLLQILLIPICAALFVSGLHFGVQTVMNVNDSGFSSHMLQSGGYQESGELMEDLRSDFEMVMVHAFDEYFYGLEEYGISVQEGEGQASEEEAQDNARIMAAAKKALWEDVSSHLEEMERYSEETGVQFYVKFLDWKYVSKNYDPKGTGDEAIGASLTCNEDGATMDGMLMDEDSENYNYMKHRMKDVAYQVENLLTEYGGSEVELAPEDLEIFIGYTTEELALREKEFDAACEQLRQNVLELAVCAAGTIVLFVILCIITGKKDETGRTMIGGLDRWPTELFLGAIPLLVILGGWIMSEVVYYNNIYYYAGYGYAYRAVREMNLQYAAAMGAAWVIAVVGLSLILCVVRKIKAGQFWKTFLCWRIFRWFFQGFKEIYYGGSAMRKMVLVILGACLLCATVIFMPLVAGALIVLAAKMIRQYEEVERGLDEIRGGNTGYRIPIEGNPRGEMQQLAAKVNDISEGFDLAVRKELKNQRMKSELISNVSHDLKTPMTSIITYIDLMKQEGLTSENAPKYLEILDEKSQRLKKLCEDLFEAAKASSGDMPVHLTRLEMVSLVNQGLGEYQDRFQEKGLQIIFHSDQEKFYVMADGQLLWRVIENLFGNLLKYAMENTRVYLDLRQSVDGDGKAYVALDVKNMSKYPLNIPADELMERFKRGDESRSTEGSGLGLAIARDLTVLQKGRFDLKIDGDLFKATVMFEEVK